MDNRRKIYLLNPKILSPETIAVAFAKTSRSPLTFNEIAEELNEAKSSEFHEKWVVGYGHSSVAEHAVLHVAVENISRLAVEKLQSSRLASYTEKSSRYQQWDRDHFFIPDEFNSNHQVKEIYVRTCQNLFDSYRVFIDKIEKYLEKTQEAREDESPGNRQRRLKSETVDVCRFLLPASALTNVGMTINARTLEHALVKLLSDPLQEIYLVGEDIKHVACRELPTLIKYAFPSSSLGNIRTFIKKEQPVFSRQPEFIPGDWCRLLAYDETAEQNILTALLFKYSLSGYGEIKEKVREAGVDDLIKLSKDIIGLAGKHDDFIRELEYGSYMFEIIMDQGAYYEFKRHRMMTQSVQKLTPYLGFTIPALVSQAGLENLYIDLMEQAAIAYEAIEEKFEGLGSYIIPNAYNRRVLCSMNFRSLVHFITLRSAQNAHFSIRRVAFRVAELVRNVSPILGHSLSESCSNAWKEIEENYFTRVH